MATLKITGLTLEQSNVLAKEVLEGHSTIIDAFNEVLEIAGVEEISAVAEVKMDEYEVGDNEIILD